MRPFFLHIFLNFYSGSTENRPNRLMTMTRHKGKPITRKRPNVASMISSKIINSFLYRKSIGKTSINVIISYNHGGTKWCA